MAPAKTQLIKKSFVSIIIFYLEVKYIYFYKIKLENFTKTTIQKFWTIWMNANLKSDIEIEILTRTPWTVMEKKKNK